MNWIPASMVSGLLSWCAYAAVEYAICTVFPLATRPGTALASWHWQLTAVTFLFYAGTGAVAGVVLGALWKPRAGAGLLAPAAVSVPVLFAIHQLVELPQGAHYGAVVALLIVAAAVYALLRPKTPLANLLLCPWLLSAAVLFPYWARGVHRLWNVPVAEKTSGVAAAIVLAGILLAIVHWRRKPEDGLSTYTMRYGAAAALIVLISVGLNRSLPDGAPSQAKGSGPNVLLIVLDTVRASSLSLHGYHRKTSPSLEQIAAEADVFTNAIAISDMTLPTHASLFTGVHGRWHEAHLQDKSRLGNRISRKFPTMAELLAARGYQTAGIAANFSYVTSAFGMDRGFAVFDSRAPIAYLADGATKQRHSLRWSVRKIIDRWCSSLPWDAVTRTAAEINADAKTVLRKAKAGSGPFFLFLNYMDAHRPYVPPPPFDTLFPGKIHPFTTTDFEKMRSDMVGGVRTISEREREHLTSQYDGGIAYLDSQIGELIRHMKSEGQFENTLIVITSDHGEALGEHDLLEHSVESIYQMHVHVPLIVKYPNQKAGRVIDTPASQIDVLPEVLAAVAIKPGAYIQGVRLSEVEKAGPRDLFTECFSGGRLNPKRAIIRWPLKWIESRQGAKELYDISKDRNEEKNLRDDHPAEAEALAAALSEWRKSAPRRQEPQEKILDEETIRRLKSLGYVQ